MVNDLGLAEAVDYGEGCLAVDAGDDAVAEAEAWSVAGSGGRDGEAAGVDGGFDVDFEELGFDEGVELLSLGGVGGLVGETGVDEEAVGVFLEVGVEGADEVFWRWLVLGVASDGGA